MRTIFKNVCPVSVSDSQFFHTVVQKGTVYTKQAGCFCFISAGLAESFQNQDPVILLLFFL